MAQIKPFIIALEEHYTDPAVMAQGKAAGAPVEVTGFVRFALGEGIEKQSGDFAAEVAKMAG